MVSKFAVLKKKQNNYTLTLEVRAMFSQCLRSALKKKNNYTLTLEVRAVFSQYIPNT